MVPGIPVTCVRSVFFMEVYQREATYIGKSVPWRQWSAIESGIRKGNQYFKVSATILEAEKQRSDRIELSGEKCSGGAICNYQITNVPVETLFSVCTC